jgi:hypothetical protein
VPELVRVTVTGSLLLTVTFPKLMLAGLAASNRVTPVPERETAAGELVALLTTERLPVRLPVVVGAKATLTVVVWPAARVRGSESPLRVNPAPVKLACETVTLAVPVLDRVTVWGLLVLPTVTFPKLRLDGLAASSKLPAPVPESETVAGELVALLTTERLPVALPATDGAKVTVKVALWPAATARGRESPLMLKPVPVTLA